MGLVRMTTYSAVFVFEYRFEDYPTIRLGPDPEDSVNRPASATTLRVIFSQVRPWSTIAARARFITVPY